MKAKTILTNLLPLVLAAAAAAQNQPPQLTNLRTEADTASRQITLYYDLADAEDPQLSVAVHVSPGPGQPFAPVAGARGDVGFPVAAGTRKKITWQYGGAWQAAKNASVQLVADDRYKINIGEMVEQVDSARLMQNLMQVYGNRNHKNRKARPHLAAVKDTIEGAFRRHRLQASRQPFQYKNYQAHNILGEKTGTTDAAQVFILCAHFDTEVKSPGGDDNGSGVAGMLEAARILSQYNFRHTLKFIGFDLEEAGWRGSLQYVNGGGVKAHEKIAGVINYDMIGYYSERVNSQLIPGGFDELFPEVYEQVKNDNFRGNFVVNTANEASDSLGRRFLGYTNAYVPALKVVSLVAPGQGQLTPALAASDHVAFWQKGYPAIHVGDGGETRNATLDTRHDTSNHLNYTFMRNVVKATVATLAELAGVTHCTVASVPLGGAATGYAAK